MEFQAVILAAGRGSRMYPLTEDCPKALLPVGNRPLIWYPAQLLENNGFQEALVIVREAHHRQISEVLDRFDSTYGIRLNFSYYSIKDASEDIGTADALREVATRNLIKNDVILLSCDLVTSVRLHTLMEFHARHNCSLTALLVRPPNKEDDTRKRSTLVERDIIALAEDSKMVYFAAMADLDDDLTLSRSIVKRYPHMRVCSQLVDAHLYLLKKWVIEYLKKNKGISSVKGELVPHLVHHQGLTIDHTYTKQTKQDVQCAAQASLDMLEQQIYSMSSFSGVHCESDAFTCQLVNCHAVLSDSELCARVNTVPAYLDVNRMIPSLLATFSISTTPTSAEPSGSRIKGVSSDSLTDVGVQLGDRVSVKKSCIGQHCIIGEKSKIINSILMDHVHIGEGCTLQNCVVCSRARVEDKVTLKDCLVGANFTVTKEADIRNETLVVGGGLHF